MKKTLDKIYLSAKYYKENCAGKFLIYISYSKENKSHSVVEVKFLKSNFLHLTGLKTSLKPNQFFDKCIKNQISIHDFTLPEDGVSQLKLDILPMLMSFKGKNFTMIGDYNGNGVRLVADKVSGNQIGFLALSKTEKDYFFPRSVIKSNTNQYIIKESHERIIYIYSKNFDEDKYSKLLYTCKSPSENEKKLPKIITELIT